PWERLTDAGHAAHDHRGVPHHHATELRSQLVQGALDHAVPRTNDEAAEGGADTWQSLFGDEAAENGAVARRDRAVPADVSEDTSRTTAREQRSECAVIGGRFILNASWCPARAPSVPRARRRSGRARDPRTG